jgi:hypothetical protein
MYSLQVFHYKISRIYCSFPVSYMDRGRVRCCATNRKVAGSIPAGVSGFFIDIKSFRSHCGPGVDSASNRNEYQEHFLGVKCGRCVRLTTWPPSCAVVTKSWNLNFLEPSGPVQACNGTALPFLHGLNTLCMSWKIFLPELFKYIFLSTSYMTSL